MDCSNLHNHIQTLALSDPDQNEDRLNILCQIYIFGRCQSSVFLKDTINNGVYERSDVCVSHPAHQEFAAVDGEDHFQVESIMRSVMGKLSDEDFYAIAPQARQFVTLCSFESTDHQYCKDLMSGMTKFMSPFMGVCYSFNYNVSNPIQACLSGENYGLKLELNVGVFGSLLRGNSPSAGAKLILHEHNKVPITNSQGIALEPGKHTQIALEYASIERQKPPYTSQCQSEWTEDTYLPDKTIPYSDFLCKSFCVDEYTQRHCNCTISYMIELDRKMAPLCDVGNPVQGKCIQEFVENLDLHMELMGKECAQCSPQCKEQHLKVIIINKKLYLKCTYILIKL